MMAVAALALTIGSVFADNYTLAPDLSNPGSFVVRNSAGYVTASYGPGPWMAGGFRPIVVHDPNGILSITYDVNGRIINVNIK